MPQVIATLFVLSIFGVIGFFIFKCVKTAEKEAKKKAEEPVDNIKSVSILGTRTGEQTKILATYNYTIYSLLVIYESGKREVVECVKDSEEFQKLIMFLDPNATSNQ